jgi:hypothetical protein
MPSDYAFCITIVNAKSIAGQCKMHFRQTIHEKFMATIHERLRWGRERAGFDTATDAAESLGVPEPTYLAHENGSRGFKHDAADRYARKFKISLDWLLTGRGQPTKGAPVKVKPIGYIGAGAEVHPIDDHALGAGFEFEEIDLPPGVPLDAILVMVRGDSMYPRYYDGEKLFYLRDARPPDELIGKECVIKLADGRMYVKRLRRGSGNGLFRLESFNADPIDDAMVEWAAPVIARVNS